jgi:hypothetical protein
MRANPCRCRCSMQGKCQMPPPRRTKRKVDSRYWYWYRVREMIFVLMRHQQLHTTTINQYTMVKPIPDNVKDLLNQLPSAQQVILRSYIATLRSEIVSYEEEKLNATNTDPHAHYHGDVKCTADHGHVDTEHVTEHHHEHKHTEHCNHDHDHKDNHTASASNVHHEHTHTEHCEHNHDHKEKGHNDHHEHEHHDHNNKHHDHDHDHDHEHDHDHNKHHHPHDGDAHHQHTTDETNHDEHVPAWKKAALSADPMEAPFGGNWHSESNVSAKSGTTSTDKPAAAQEAMEE